MAVAPFAGLDKRLGYLVPEALEAVVQVGSLVRVPLRNRVELGIVRALEAPGDFPRARLKYLQGVVWEFPVLTPDLLALADWMSAYYAVGLDTVFETMIPPAARAGMAKRTRRMLRVVGGPADAAEAEAFARRAKAQARLLECLRQQPQGADRRLVLQQLNVGDGVADGLIARGWVEAYDEVVEREAYNDAFAGTEHEAAAVAGTVTLNGEQRAAADSIASSLRAGGFRAHLLHGVTGSGKTEVYLAALEAALAEGGGVCFLVPEVALAPQTVGRLRARLEGRLGTRVVVWHSHLAAGERLDAWHALASGAARVVVGARSAIFAPVRNLRLVLVDEEHEPAYKQSESPRYHGRDTAVYRAWKAGAVCVLGSATPALESLHNVVQGRYTLNRLTKRVDDRALPLVHVVDLRREMASRKGMAVLSRVLADKMRDRFEKKEQTILFLNRRGYSTSMLCPDCGHVEFCQHCSAPVTYHRIDERLRCHLCGYEQSAPERCPKCRSTGIRGRGFGTQRVEEIANKILPKARIVRLDSDALQRRHLFREILADFRTGKIDVLIGTQMIAKGLDFPNVTLVGLVDADLSMNINDFRAAERTFQLVVQVAGRAGRGDRAGEVVVQSFLPASPPIQFGRRQDFDGFAAEELAQRREFGFPPFRHLIVHLFRGRNPEKVAFFAEQFVRAIEAEPIPDLELRGPRPCAMEKIRDEYRFEVWYLVHGVPRPLAEIRRRRAAFKMDPDVFDVLDVDPLGPP